MQRFLQHADDVIRRRPWTEAAETSLPTLVALIATFGLIYGAAMGSFGAQSAGSTLQMLYSGLKVPLLLMATFALSLPSYFVVNTLLGLRADFAEAIRALLATQAGLSVVLASLAPLTLMWYTVSDNYPAAVLFNAAMFAVASFTAQIILRGYYQPLVRRNPLHRWMLRAWIVVYAFVGIQMGWVLRPFIGEPSQPPQFFRQQAWGNAYIEVARLIREVLRTL